MTPSIDKKKQIERLKSQYEQNPNSQVFAALAELYRETGQLKLAEKIAREGVKKHQRFATGILVYGRIMKDLNELDQAEIYLKKAVQLSPESILAHQLCGELYLQLKKPKEALKAYKMVLLLKPNSNTARRAVNRLESLTADEYDEETFQISKLSALSQKAPPEPVVNDKPVSTVSNIEELRQQSTQSKYEVEFKKANEKAIERILSLVDAFIVRNDLNRALELLTEAENEFDRHPEIEKRKKLIFRSQNLHLNEDEDARGFSSSDTIDKNVVSKSSREELVNAKKLYILDLLLQRVEAYRHDHLGL